MIHSRDAAQDTLDLLKKYQPKGIVHCFSGSAEMAQEVVKLGMYVGFTGVITFKNARRSLEIIEWLPMDRIMVETDAPYLTPEPFRGKRNDFGYVHFVSEKIAELKGITPEEAARITTENGRRFFRIDR